MNAVELLNASLWKHRLVQEYFSEKPTTVKGALLIQSWLRLQHKQNGLVAKYAPRIKKFLERLRVTLVKAIRKAASLDNLERIIHKETLAAMPGIFLALYKETVKIMGKMTINFVRMTRRTKSVDELDDKYDAWERLESLRELFVSLSYTKSQTLSVAIYSALSKLFKDVVVSGEIIDMEEAIKKLQDASGFSKARAERIARTEIHTATMEAQFESAKKFLPPGTHKMWMATLDGRVRDAHMKANNQTIPLDEPFSVGGEDMMFPGDPNGSPGNVINCRCSMVFTLPFLDN
jgi:hypothetical protein